MVVYTSNMEVGEGGGNERNGRVPRFAEGEGGKGRW